MQKVIPLALGGLWKSGDLTTVPGEFAIEAKNVLLRPGGRLIARGGFRQKAISTSYGGTPIGFAKRYDMPTSKDVLYALTSEIPSVGPPSTVYLAAKADAVTLLSTNFGGYAYDWAQMSDRTFVTVRDDQAIGIKELSSAGGLQPLDDDTTQIDCGTVAGFGERLFAGDIEYLITNYVYDTDDDDVYFDSGHGWTLTGVTLKTTTLTTGESLNYLVPSAATGTTEQAELGTFCKGEETTFLSKIRNRSKTEVCPMTFSIYVSQAAARSTAYNVGQLRAPDTANGYYYRVTAAAGTKLTAVGAPIWPTTIGTTVVDNEITWRCEGLAVIATQEVNLPAADDVDNLWSGIYVQSADFSDPNVYLGVRIEFGTALGTTWPVDGVDVGFRDGLANGNALKACQGQQFTAGRIKYPFYNAEAAGFGTVTLRDHLIWTEIRDLVFRAQDFIQLYDTPGTVTMLCALAGRFIVAKDNSLYIWGLTENPDSPLTRERLIHDVGCIGCKAYDIHNDTLFFIGQDEVYMMGPGGDPQPLAGDAMREEIFNRGSDWVPDNTYDQPLLAVDKLNKEIHVYTQKGRIFVYNLRTQTWTELAISYDADGSPDELSDMIWFDNVMWYACKNLGMGYLDESKVDGDGDSAHPIEVTYDFPVFEARGPRTEIFVDWMDLHHKIATATSLTMMLSRDGDTNFDVLNTITVRTAADGKTEKQEVDIQQTAVSHRIRLTRTAAKSGPSTMTLTGAELHVQIKGAESPVDKTASTASTL